MSILYNSFKQVIFKKSVYLRVQIQAELTTVAPSIIEQSLMTGY